MSTSMRWCSATAWTSTGPKIKEEGPHIGVCPANVLINIILGYCVNLFIIIILFINNWCSTLGPTAYLPSFATWRWSFDSWDRQLSNDHRRLVGEWPIPLTEAKMAELIWLLEAVNNVGVGGGSQCVWSYLKCLFVDLLRLVSTKL